MIQEVSRAEADSGRVILTVESRGLVDTCVLAVTLSDDVSILRHMPTGGVENGSRDDLAGGVVVQLWTQPWVGDQSCPARAVAYVVLVMG